MGLAAALPGPDYKPQDAPRAPEARARKALTAPSRGAEVRRGAGRRGRLEAPWVRAGRPGRRPRGARGGCLCGRGALCWGGNGWKPPGGPGHGGPCARWESSQTRGEDLGGARCTQRSLGRNALVPVCAQTRGAGGKIAGRRGRSRLSRGRARAEVLGSGAWDPREGSACRTCRRAESGCHSLGRGARGVSAASLANAGGLVAGARARPGLEVGLRRRLWEPPLSGCCGRTCLGAGRTRPGDSALRGGEEKEKPAKGTGEPWPWSKRRRGVPNAQ